MSTIYLLRHGALPDNSRKRFIGQTDLPLAAEGIRQAQALAHALRDTNFGSIYCSDLRRTHQTAEIIVAKTRIPIQATRDLREISLGHWEGLLRSEVKTSFPEQYAARGDDIENCRVPGGESFADCRLRALTAWEKIVNCGGDHIVIVSHAGINRLLLCHLLGIPMTHMFRIAQDYGCVNIVQQTGESICVKLVNGRPTDICSDTQ
ncbi:MAG TPA: alpha-ribazole phosphatase [Rhodoferax sp.]